MSFITPVVSDSHGDGPRFAWKGLTLFSHCFPIETFSPLTSTLTATPLTALNFSSATIL